MSETNEVVGRVDRVAVAPAELLDQLGRAVEEFDNVAVMERRRVIQQRQLGETARKIMVFQAVLTACRAAGLEQLAHQSPQVKDAGKWEHLVELVDVSWELPGYRTVTLTLAHWPRKTHLYTVADCEFWHWKPASEETGGEVASWSSVDPAGEDKWCDSLAEALSVAKVRGGQYAPSDQATRDFITG